MTQSQYRAVVAKNSTIQVANFSPAPCKSMEPVATADLFLLRPSAADQNRIYQEELNAEVRKNLRWLGILQRDFNQAVAKAVEEIVNQRVDARLRDAVESLRLNLVQERELRRETERKLKARDQEVARLTLERQSWAKLEDGDARLCMSVEHLAERQPELGFHPRVTTAGAQNLQLAKESDDALILALKKWSEVDHVPWHTIQTTLEAKRLLLCLLDAKGKPMLPKELRSILQSTAEICEIWNKLALALVQQFPSRVFMRFRHQRNSYYQLLKAA